jgi:hypothetical protein
MSLSEDEIVVLYGKRWCTEPFFKVCKSCLKLEKELQLRSFDGICAHTAVVFTRYIMLALACRENNVRRSVCELFYAMCNAADDISFAQAFGMLMEMFVQLLADHLHLSKEKLGEAVNHFISSLPAWIKGKLPLSMCES